MLGGWAKFVVVLAYFFTIGNSELDAVQSVNHVDVEIWGLSEFGLPEFTKLAGGLYELLSL